MIERYLSDKIKFLSLFSIILVLYIHSGFHNYPHEILGMKFNNMLQELISEKIGRCVSIRPTTGIKPLYTTIATVTMKPIVAVAIVLLNLFVTACISY